MNPPSHFRLTLPDLVDQLREAMEGAMTAEDIQKLCDLLYTASLLKEEGRVVRARIMIAPPEAFASPEGPPDGIHAIRFTLPHELTAHEIKRLSPAASFFHSVIAIWPERGRFRIWGILNTGPRWLNLVAGGRKPLGQDFTHPVIHVRDPGWLLFYRGYRLMAEWRGRELHGPRLDVFQARLFVDRFRDLRRELVAEVHQSGLPATLSLEIYAELAHLIALQFIKRIINLVRTSGHGGSLIMLPEGPAGLAAATRWIDCKYSASAEPAGLRFRGLLQAIIRRVGELSPARTGLDAAWDLFRHSRDPELDRLEEAFFELARLFSDLMQVDGALVIDQRLCIIGFGGEIRVDRNLLKVGHAHDLNAAQVTEWSVRADGTRHRSVYRLCSVEPEVIGFVISQDSQVRLIANVGGEVIFWMHTGV
ncbi:MAG TPA: hypothetical protein VIS74_01470 [Chthoniobacterales bacterium]